jgi:hypothetical protein
MKTVNGSHVTAGPQPVSVRARHHRQHSALQVTAFRDWLPGCRVSICRLQCNIPTSGADSGASCRRRAAFALVSAAAACSSSRSCSRRCSTRDWRSARPRCTCMLTSCRSCTRKVAHRSATIGSGHLLCSTLNLALQYSALPHCRQAKLEAHRPASPGVRLTASVLLPLPCPLPALLLLWVAPCRQ